MRALVLVVLIALALVPAASAGTAESPDISDEAGDAGVGNEVADLTAAWLAQDANELTVMLQLAKLEGPATGAAWLLRFSLDGEGYYAGAFDDINDKGPAIRFFVGPWDEVGPADYEPIDGEAMLGAPATITFTLARAKLEGVAGRPLEDAATLEAIEAWTGVVTTANLGLVRFPPSGPGYQTFDTAQGADLIFGLGANSTSPLAPANGKSDGGADGAPSRLAPLAPAGLALAAALAVARARRR